MKNFKLHLLIVLVILFTYNSCKKDDVTDNGSTSNASQYFGNAVTITAKGRIIDANGNAVVGAIVKGGSITDTTDIMGVFQLSSFAAHENLGCVTVEKLGYFKGVRSFVPKSGGNELLIRLLSKSNNGTINSVNGGTVTVPNIKLTLPANGVQLNNAVYNGTVNVAIKHINPTSTTFFEEMPGSLVGVDGNQSSVLTSYGMVGVELTDNSGQKLQIANGKTAEVRFEVPASLLSSAPATIDLWSLDEVNGYWKKEGTATLVNNEYVAQVSHFSFWNCDVPTSCVYIDGQVVFSQNQLPIAGATVTISSLNSGSRWDITNSLGQFIGAVPSGQTLGITVSVQCSGSATIVYSNTIGPLTVNTTLNPITITLPNSTILTGTVFNCNNLTANNSYVSINGQIVFTNNGQYNASACGGNIVLSAFGFDPYIVGQTQSVTLTGGVQNTNLQVCGGGNTITDIDGNNYATVIIGTQEWMKENLKTTHYRNGIAIPSALSNIDWMGTSASACADYDNDVANSSIYGKLYNWYTVADPSGLCPSGWHVPNSKDWNILIKMLDPAADTLAIGEVSSTAGGAMKEIGISHWANPNVGATNTSGFSGLPGGSRNQYGQYFDAQYGGSWWSASDSTVTEAMSFALVHHQSSFFRFSIYKSGGFSVRCVKD